MRPDAPSRGLLRGGIAAAVTLVALVAGDASAAPRHDRPERAERGTRGPERGGDPATESNTEAFKYFQFGNQYLQQGLLKQAEDSFRRALSLQPNYAECDYVLGVVLLELNDYRGALSQAQRALAQNPFLTEAHNLMGMTYAKMGDYDAALKEFQVVLGDASFPTPEVAHFNIGKVAWERQTCAEAVVHFRRAVELNEQFWRAWYLLGDCQESLGQRVQARQAYEKALEIVPDEVGPMYRLGFLCFQENDTACARQYFDKVRLTDPGSPMASGAREYLRQLNFR